MFNKIGLALVLGLCSVNVLADDGLLYEMRTYTANEGKLDALHERFRNHTMSIFEKHGMQNVGYWVPADTPDTLIYIIAHKDAESAQDSWQAFVADPQWQDVYAKSIADGRLVKNIVNVFMTKTDYSP
ncbi:MAG: NIPSNAP family protein [Pseudomonadaceae bacterium]|nr:NIPSNAP family protein [Pseudomonadaceae bacterium]